MGKITKSLILMIIAIFLMTVTVYASDFSVKMESAQEESEITLKIILEQVNITGSGINALIFDLEYDRDIFETVTLEDITTENGWEDLTYNEKSGSLLTLRSDFTKTAGEEIVTIKLHEKATAKSGKTDVKITNIQASNSQQDLEAENQIIKVNVGGNGIGKVITTIGVVIVIIIALLFIRRFLIKKANKRRKKV